MALTEEQNKIPLKLLQEIEAYLSFRIAMSQPVEVEEMKSLRDDVNACLLANGINTAFQPDKIGE